MSAPSTSGLSVELLLRVIDVKYGSFTFYFYDARDKTSERSLVWLLRFFHVSKSPNTSTAKRDKMKLQNIWLINSVMEIPWVISPANIDIGLLLPVFCLFYSTDKLRVLLVVFPPLLPDGKLS